MDTCPNCEAPTRPGARFCTICGHRYSIDASLSLDESIPDLGASSQGPKKWPTGGWPHVPANKVRSPATVDWDWRPATDTREQGDSSELVSSGWPVQQSPSQTPESEDAAEHAEAENLALDAVSAEEAAVADVGFADDRNREAVHRLGALISELKLLLSEVTLDETPDLSGVVSDLEVAVHPPGAVEPERAVEPTALGVGLAHRPELASVPRFSRRNGRRVERRRRAAAQGRQADALRRALRVGLVGLGARLADPRYAPATPARTAH